MATTQTQPAENTQPAEKKPSSRPCPNCAETLSGAPCQNCGWEPGLVPVAVTQTADGPVTTFAAEKRHRFMLIFGVLACLLGVAIVGSQISGGSAGGIAAGIIFGPLVFAAGVITLKNTRGGKAWWGLSAKEKGMAVPGLIAGACLGMLIIPILLICVAFMKMSTDAWRG
jgi:hypothetical protein